MGLTRFVSSANGHIRETMVFKKKEGKIVFLLIVTMKIDFSHDIWVESFVDNLVDDVIVEGSFINQCDLSCIPLSVITCFIIIVTS